MIRRRLETSAALAGFVAVLASCQPGPHETSSPDDASPAVTSAVFASPPNCVDLTGDPQAEMELANLPEKIDVRATQCPAVMQGKASGKIQLEVTVECNGLVSDARVIEGIGHGCDELAANALRNGRFQAAHTTGGKNARVRINYVYDYGPVGPSEPGPESPAAEASPTPAPPAGAPPVEAPPAESAPPAPPL